MISMWVVLKICWLESNARPESSLSIRSGRSCANFVKKKIPLCFWICQYLHDRLKLDVPIRALPAGHQVEHVHAGRRPPVLDAPAAGQLHADAGEQREARDLVPHPEQPRVEVDLRGQRGDGDEAGVPDEQERRDRLVEEARLDVGRLLEHDEVPSRPLGRRDLPDDSAWSVKKIVCVRARMLVP